MNKILPAIFIILSGLFFFDTSMVHAQMGSIMDVGNADNEVAVEDDHHGESIEVVIQDLLIQHNVSTIQELDCDQVSDDDLERLGDAVMEQQHPGEAHEVMDEMMGGEGSESLRLMHINMGSSYLGCGGGHGIGMMSMMGYKDTSNNNNYYHGGIPMMGFSGGMMSGYGIFAGLTWIALIAFLLSGVYFFIKQANKK